MGLAVAPCSPPTRTVDEVLAHFGESDGGAWRSGCSGTPWSAETPTTSRWR